MLRLDGVRKRFGGAVAVDDVSAEFAPGVIYGLIGPNGSGKSTLLNLISGFYALDAGMIQLNGARIDRRPPHTMAALGIVRTFQMPRSFGSLSVLDNLLVPVAADHRPESLGKVRARGLAALEQTGLAALAGLPAAALSGGQTMLLQLGRALMHEPVHLLLLDEPFAGVTPAIKDQMMRTIRQLNRERGATVLVVSHEMSTLRQLCDEALVMNLGRVVARGELDEVTALPEVVEAYLGKPV
jgi:branched-chain amino acid transport system ATP-binding protein